MPLPHPAVADGAHLCCVSNWQLPSQMKELPCFRDRTQADDNVTPVISIGTSHKRIRYTVKEYSPVSISVPHLKHRVARREVHRAHARGCTAACLRTCANVEVSLSTLVNASSAPKGHIASRVVPSTTPPLQLLDSCNMTHRDWGFIAK